MGPVVMILTVNSFGDVFPIDIGSLSMSWNYGLSWILTSVC